MVIMSLLMYIGFLIYNVDAAVDVLDKEHYVQASFSRQGPVGCTDNPCAHAVDLRAGECHSTTRVGSINIAAWSLLKGQRHAVWFGSG